MGERGNIYDYFLEEFFMSGTDWPLCLKTRSWFM